MTYLDLLHRFLVANWETVLAVVIGDLVVAAVLGIYGIVIRRRSKPKFVVETTRRGNKLGFQVHSKNRSITEVAVFCDNLLQVWENEGKEIEKVDLFVGGPPVAFFPYEIISRRSSDVVIAVDLVSYRKGQQFGKMQQWHNFSVAESAKETLGDRDIQVHDADVVSFIITPSIRFVAKEIEEVRHYHPNLTLTSKVQLNERGQITDSSTEWSMPK